MLRGAGYPRIIWIKIPVFQWPMDLYPYTDCTTRIVRGKRVNTTRGVVIPSITRNVRVVQTP